MLLALRHEGYNSNVVVFIEPDVISSQARGHISAIPDILATQQFFSFFGSARKNNYLSRNVHPSTEAASAGPESFTKTTN